MPKFNLYSAWMDPLFYVWAAVFAAGLVSLVVSARKFMSLKGAAAAPAAEDEHNPFVDPEEGPADGPEQAADLPAEQPELPVPDEAPAPVKTAAVSAAAPAAAAVPASDGGSKAETFVRGIYEGISGIDARLKKIEASLPRAAKPGSDFTVKFLEDILQDIDTLDKSKIKARIEYLVSDLKK